MQGSEREVRVQVVVLTGLLAGLGAALAATLIQLGAPRIGMSLYVPVLILPELFASVAKRPMTRPQAKWCRAIGIVAILLTLAMNLAI